MKSMMMPAVFLLIVILFVIVNGVMIDKYITALIEQVEELPDTPNDSTLEQIEKIEDKWKEKEEWVSIVVKFDSVYNFAREWSSAKAGVISDDPGTYLAAKKGMINILKYIRDIQQFRIDNII